MTGTRTVPDYEILIGGAGFSGIGMAIMLDRAGFGDYLILEAGAVRCLTEARRRAARRIEVRREANDRFFAEMMHKRHRQIFWQDTCSLANSYYFDKHGDVPLGPAGRRPPTRSLWARTRRR